MFWFLKLSCSLIYIYIIYITYSNKFWKFLHSSWNQKAGSRNRGVHLHRYAMLSKWVQHGLWSMLLRCAGRIYRSQLHTPNVPTTELVPGFQTPPTPASTTSVSRVEPDAFPARGRSSKKRFGPMIVCPPSTVSPMYSRGSLEWFGRCGPWEMSLVAGFAHPGRSKEWVKTWSDYRTWTSALLWSL